MCRLAATLGLSAAAVRDSVGDLVAHGAGRLAGGRWTIDQRAEIDRLLDRLLDRLSGRAAGRS